MSDADAAELEEGRRSGILFSVQRSVRYHDRRRSHYERLNKLTDLFTILLAGVVFLDLLGDKLGDRAHRIVQVCAAIGALLGATDLLFGFAKSADLHRHLKRQYIELEKKCSGAFSVEDIRMQRLSIEADEPPIFCALDILCHNEVATSIGLTRETDSDAFRDLPVFMRRTANWWRWEDAGTDTAGRTEHRPDRNS
jgi:hypothetical protein